MTRIFKLLPFMTIFLLLSAASSVPSFFEQKLKLEQKLKTQVEEVLSKLTTSDSFNVNVAISASSPTVPNWDDPDSPEAKKKANEKKKKEKKLAAEKPEEKKVDISLKNKVTFDDVDLPDRQEDFIVLNKFGLEAPLIDDYQDFAPDGKIIMKMDTGLDSGPSEEEKEAAAAAEEERRMMMEKMMKGGKKVSEVEKMWKFNEAVDIYKNLEAVDITVQLSKGLENDIKQAAEKYVRNIAFNLGDVKPKIKFEYVNLGRDFASTEGSKKDIMDYLGLLAQFATLIGIILGVLLFGMVGNKLIKKYFELNTGTQNQSNMSMDSPQKEEDDDDDAGAGGMLGGGPGGEAGNDLIVNGVERFQNFYENNPEDSILLVKKWIREKTKPQVLALKALVQQMDNKSLSPMMKELSEDERGAWKETLDSGLNPEELGKANAYIGNQIIQNLMVPEYIRDPEIYAKLIKIKATEFSNFLNKDLETACLLLPVLGTDFINQVLNSVDQGLREKVLANSLAISPASYEGSEEKIKTLLSEVENVSTSKPFLKSLEKLLPKAAKDLEEGLFKHFINEANDEDVQRIFKDFFPGFLIKELPEAFLKNTLNKYPLQKKVRLLYSLEDSEKEYYSELFAAPGTKAHDLLNLEFENIERDEALQKDIANEKDNLWGDFVSFVRSQIKSDQKVAGQVNEITEGWRSQNASGSKGEPHLKAVA